jgi:4'-phosphopantetheinyl transferase EntD
MPLTLYATCTAGSISLERCGVVRSPHMITLVALIEKLLPSGVVAVDTRDDWLNIVLSPEEEATLGQAADRRRREFVTARGCAQQALKQLGLPPSSIPIGPQGEPRWPDGVVGSITHCAGYRACALAHAGSTAAVGIDAEPHEALPHGVLSAITGTEERAWLTELMHAKPTTHWDRLAFSAKEAVYKTWFSLTRGRLELEDVIVTFDTVKQVFHARMPIPGPLVDQSRPTALDGRWLASDGLVLTAITLPQSSSALPR